MRPVSSYLYGHQQSPYRHHAPPNPNRGAYGTFDNKKWPEDIECVWPANTPHKGHIYISNVEAAENPRTLSKLQIKAVMTCARGYNRNVPTQQLTHYEYFPCDDKETCQIDMYFDSAADFIVKALKETNILVHCIAGVSRSVSMVLAYLIREHDMSYEEAYTLVKKRRKIIHPNDGFIDQLKRYADSARMKVRKQHKEPQKINNKNAEPDHPQPRLDQTDNLHTSSLQLINHLPHEMLYSFGTREPGEGDRHAYTPTKPTNREVHKYSYSQHKVQKREEPADVWIKNRTGTKGRNNLEDEPVAAKNHNPERPSYFQAMNKELNEKIEAIHAKYEKQRQELIGKRANTGDKYYHTDKKYANQSSGNIREQVKGWHPQHRNTKEEDTYERYYRKNEIGYGRFEANHLNKYMLAMREADFAYTLGSNKKYGLDQYGGYQPARRAARLYY